MSTQIKVSWVTDPFHPSMDAPVTKLMPVGSSIRQCVRALVGSDEFDLTTVCIVNESPVLRKDWDKPLLATDRVVFVSYQGYFIAWWGWMLIAAAIAAAVYLSIPRINPPDTPGDATAHTLTGQRNRNRLGMPIECAYGRVRMYPSLAAQSYNQNINNQQFQYSLYSLGHGEFDIDQVRIEDTPIADFPEAEWKHIKAGERVELFRDNVTTSVAVANVEMLSHERAVDDRVAIRDWRNVTSLTGDTVQILGVDADFPINLTNPLAFNAVKWNGWFTVGAQGAQIERIEMDVEFPSGIQYTNDKGNTFPFAVRFIAEAERITDTGAVVEGSRFWLFDRVFRGNSSDPLRFTLGRNVEPGRYQVRAARYTLTRTKGMFLQKMYWTRLRAFGPNRYTYPTDVIAVKAQATNGLNDQAATRLNVWLTRKLPTWSPSTGWTAPVPTRSKIWAFCDVWRSKYGANLSDEFLDLETLYKLHLFYGGDDEKRNEKFDWIFDQRMSVWEAGRLILGSGRALPILYGSRVSAVRDQAKEFPVMIFGDSNIRDNSFSVDVEYARLGDNDGIEVEYTDPTDFLPSTVLCTIDEPGDMPRSERIVGIANRVHAYREGLYRRAREKYERVRVQFITGSQGYLLKFNDLIAVSKMLPNWGQNGSVLAYDDDERILTLSCAVDLADNEVNIISINTKDGQVEGPLVIGKGPQPNQVVLTQGPLNLSRFIFDDNFELPVFVLGTRNAYHANIVVDSITPKSLDEVEITGYVYRPEPHQYDSTEPPAAEVDGVLRQIFPIPAAPQPLTVTPSPVYVDRVIVSWPSVEGALHYRIEISTDDRVSWTTARIGFNNSLEISVDTGVEMWIRVAAVNSYRSQWSETGPHIFGLVFDAPVVDIAGDNLVDVDGTELTGPRERRVANPLDLEIFIAEIIGEVVNIGNGLASVPGFTGGDRPGFSGGTGYSPPPNWDRLDWIEQQRQRQVGG